MTADDGSLLLLTSNGVGFIAVAAWIRALNASNEEELEVVDVVVAAAEVEEEVEDKEDTRLILGTGTEEPVAEGMVAVEVSKLLLAVLVELFTVVAACGGRVVSPRLT